MLFAAVASFPAFFHFSVPFLIRDFYFRTSLSERLWRSQQYSVVFSFLESVIIKFSVEWICGEIN